MWGQENIRLETAWSTNMNVLPLLQLLGLTGTDIIPPPG